MIERIIEEIKEILEDPKIELSKDTSLIGDNSPMDSMNIVNLCIRLEEISEDMGFVFDWTGETMSKSKSMFRSIENLALEFDKQKSNNK